MLPRQTVNEFQGLRVSKLAMGLVVPPPHSQASSSLRSTDVNPIEEVHCSPLEITTMHELVFAHTLFSVFIDLSFLIIVSNNILAASVLRENLFLINLHQ